jgi:hypothetical protein
MTHFQNVSRETLQLFGSASRLYSPESSAVLSKRENRNSISLMDGHSDHDALESLFALIRADGAT